MPPPNRPKNRPNRPKRNRPRRRPSGSGSGRRGGGSRRATAKREANRRAERNRDNARSGQTRKESRQATGGTSTGRESGIAAANTYNRNKKEKSLQQSVGSLDRRVEKALAAGNTALAKDLRSRQKNFVKDLAYERARKTPGGIMKGNVRTSDGKRPLTSAGFDVFQETMDQDFIDPTRKLQNRRDGNYKEMYPFSAGLQKGLPSARIIKKFFDQEEKDIPYNLEDMPGVRYPLDIGFGAGEGEPAITTRSNRQSPLDEAPFTISDRQPGLDSKPFTVSDRQAAIDRGIDPNFIFPVQDDLSTEIIETDSNDGSALQLAEAANTNDTLSDIVEQVTNQKNLNVSPNVFALPEQVKEKLNKDAEVNRKTYEIETYGKEITSDDLAKSGVNEAYYNMNYDTPLVQKQLLQEGVLEEKDVQAPIVNNLNIERKGNLPGQIAAAPLDLIGLVSGLNYFEPYSNMTDYVREKAFVPQTQYTGPEFMEKMQADTNKAIKAIEDSQNLNADQKTQLTDFVNSGGVNLTPTSIGGVQTNDPYNFTSEPVVFDDYVQQRLNKLR